MKDEFGRDGEVVDIRGSGVFDVPGDDVYVRYWEKTSAQTALRAMQDILISKQFHLQVKLIM